jgi:hypothetical protein
MSPLGARTRPKKIFIYQQMSVWEFTKKVFKNYEEEGNWVNERYGWAEIRKMNEKSNLDWLALLT